VRALLLCLAVSAANAAVLVTLSTSSVSLSGGGSATLTALVTGAGICPANCGVTWSYSPQVGALGGGNAPNGSGQSLNNYAAPQVVTLHQSITITATSSADNTQSASVTIQINPTGITVSPSSATLSPGGSQAFTATGGGSGYIWSVNPQVGSISANGVYTAPSSVSSTQNLTVTATSDADSTIFGTAKITVSPNATVGVSISPTAATLTAGATQQFTATVTNASSTAVNWSISPQVGSIDQTGLYTAPGIISASSKVTVTATSVADGSKSASATITLNTTIDVGAGAPTPAIQQAFISAFFRNGFFNQVTLPPIGNVTKSGTGYIQTFNGVVSGTKFALATIPTTPPPADGTNTVVQLTADLYAYYATVGAGTAGLPLYDTQSCPVIDQTNSCTYDYFDKSFVLFAYHAPLTTGQNFTISGVYYTEWVKQNGIAGLGRPVDVVTNPITSSTGVTAGTQPYINGAIFTITSGTLRNTTVSVLEPIYDLYVSSGGFAGYLGLPTAEEIVLPSGDHRQTFEGGVLQYSSTGPPTTRPPVSSVVISGQPAGNTVTLNLGQTLNLTATPTSSHGDALTDRPVSWSTTNSKVISITPSGLTAVIKASGGGAASLTAASEGVASPKLNFIVIAPCCQVGDGATPAVQQSFNDALTRNRLNIVIPVPSPAARVGNGYVQMVQSADASGAVYMLAESDAVGTAYVVAGAQLAAYQALGGPAGTLGYPLSDASAGGTQKFENGAALAGNPVRLVGGGVLTKWMAMGAETGAAGPPTGDPAVFSTFGANSGNAQAFTGGTIFAASAGPKSGQAWYVTGLILARYNALGAANGNFGMPTSDEFVSVGVHQQNFEGGNITYSPGDAAAVEHPGAKAPGIIVSPSTVTAGAKARLAIVGFNNNSTLKVSVTGQPDFTVTTANGAFSWDVFFPLTASSATVSIHAVDTKSTSTTADGTLTVRGFNTNRIALAKVQGDNQSGLPGALLPISLRVALKDSTGNPVAGAAVTFEASSGAQVLTPSTVSDANGLAETYVRLQSSEGIALVNATAAAVASAPVSFAIRAAASSLSNFPKLQQAGDTTIGNGTATITQKGALLTAVATILRYHQNRSELPSPNGYADPVTLNGYLTGYCPADAKGNVVCDGYFSNPDSGEQVLNLWRAAQFTGGADVDILPASGQIADFLAQGSPVLISLGLSVNGVLAGGHYVIATGVASDGSIVIQDPNITLARTNLNDYLNGFSAAGNTWKADLRGAARFALRSPAATRFLLAAISQPPALVQSMALSANSATGVCGLSLDLMDAVDIGAPGSGKALLSRIAACDGVASTYQIRVGVGQPFHALVSDLSAGGSLTDVSGSILANYKATRPKLNLALAAQDVSFTADGVVNAATFAPGISPGEIISIFGAGLSDPSAATTVDIDGAALNLLLSSPFQLNAVVPGSVTPGTHMLTVHSAFGAAQQQITVSAVAPGIFLVGNPPVGALTNVSFALLSPTNPLPRGQTLIIFGTGLGAVTQKGSLSNTNATVTVMLNGIELPVQFAGLAPTFSGLYQVQIAIPAATPPGLGIPLTLKVGGQVGNTVLVALQ
jgi:uncharacterized protein (TIGR03437 family)